MTTVKIHYIVLKAGKSLPATHALAGEHASPMEVKTIIHDCIYGGEASRVKGSFTIQEIITVSTIDIPEEE